MKGICIYSLAIGLMISGIQLKAQSVGNEVKISGQVMDESKLPVAGVHLCADEKWLSNVTGNKGQFKIKVPSGTKNIGVFISSETIIDVPYDGSSNVVIVIPDSIHKKMKVSTPAKVKSTSRDYSSYTNIYEALRTIPSVKVSGTEVIVRGAGTSLNSETVPIFVVDGIIVYSINEINPTDVESIEVLRGPDASMYGAQGASGVIVIHLKKNKKLSLK